jgi:hypothetical protein
VTSRGSVSVKLPVLKSVVEREKELLVIPKMMMKLDKRERK